MDDLFKPVLSKGLCINPFPLHLPPAGKALMTSWYDQSQNGKLSLLPDLNEFCKIYKDINSKTNLKYPKIQLSIEEEAMMRSFYHSKIRDICGALEYSLMVEYDAHIFLHNYFLKHGILDYDIKHSMLSCIYLGTKTQNMHITMDNFASKIPNIQADLITLLEIIVLAANNFMVPQFSPITCLYGFLIDSLPFLDKMNDYDDISQKAIDRLQTAFMIEDIMLLETPSHIALACILESDNSFEAYWEERLNKLDNMVGLFQNIQKIRQKLENYSEVSADLLRPIDKKIRSARSNE